MSAPLVELAGLDKLTNEPARLAMVAALHACDSADFLYLLLRLTGLSKGNLSAHLTKLEADGLVELTKSFEGNTPRTTVRLTGHGHEAVAAYWQRLDTLLRQARRWRPGRSA